MAKPQAHRTHPEQPKAEQAKPKVRMIRAVYGDMIDPTDNARYTKTPSEVPAVVREGSWLDSQMKAGKLELC